MENGTLRVKSKDALTVITVVNLLFSFMKDITIHHGAQARKLCCSVNPVLFIVMYYQNQMISVLFPTYFTNVFLLHYHHYARHSVIISNLNNCSITLFISLYSVYSIQSIINMMKRIIP